MYIYMLVYIYATYIILRKKIKYWRIYSIYYVYICVYAYRCAHTPPPRQACVGKAHVEDGSLRPHALVA